MPRLIVKRHLLLLEVMIAFAILVLCALPLIYPHVYMVRMQREFTDKIELDQSANLIYAEILQRLYRNEIPWNDIEQSRLIPVDDELLRPMGQDNVFPFKGRYQFTVARHKKEKGVEFEAYVLNVAMAFIPRNADDSAFEDENDPRRISYKFQVFVARDVHTEKAPGEELSPHPPQQPLQSTLWRKSFPLGSGCATLKAFIAVPQQTALQKNIGIALECWAPHRFIMSGGVVKTSFGGHYG